MHGTWPFIKTIASSIIPNNCLFVLKFVLNSEFLQVLLPLFVSVITNPTFSSSLCCRFKQSYFCRFETFMCEISENVSLKLRHHSQDRCNSRILFSNIRSLIWHSVRSLTKHWSPATTSRSVPSFMHISADILSFSPPLGSFILLECSLV